MERPATKGTLIHFRCGEPAHARPDQRVSGTVTLVEGLWAFCPMDVRADGHDWRPTGGVTMEDLLAAAP
jgi:hypothetical protein